MTRLVMSLLLEYWNIGKTHDAQNVQPVSFSKMQRLPLCVKIRNYMNISESIVVIVSLDNGQLRECIPYLTACLLNIHVTALFSSLSPSLHTLKPHDLPLFPTLHSLDIHRNGRPMSLSAWRQHQLYKLNRRPFATKRTTATCEKF
jgi:hypothetical protein